MTAKKISTKATPTAKAASKPAAPTPVVRPVDAPVRAAGEPASRPTDATSAAARPAPDHDAIAARAYAIYVARGGQHGCDVDDWAQAERELLGG